MLFLFLALCIEEDGIDYNGHDIPGERKTTANSQECADFAASITGGLYWTFKKSDGMCYVKSSNSGRHPQGHAVSGNRQCGKKTCLRFLLLALSEAL